MGSSRIIKSHLGTVRDVSFSKNDLLLLSASDDKSCKIWDVPTCKFRCSLIGHSNWIRSANFTDDSKLIVSGSDDKTIKIWDVRSRDCVNTFYDHSELSFCDIECIFDST